MHPDGGIDAYAAALRIYPAALAEKIAVRV
jgi:hypothetical protein